MKLPPRSFLIAWAFSHAVAWTIWLPLFIEPTPGMMGPRVTTLETPSLYVFGVYLWVVVLESAAGALVLALYRLPFWKGWLLASSAVSLFGALPGLLPIPVGYTLTLQFTLLPGSVWLAQWYILSRYSQVALLWPFLKLAAFTFAMLLGAFPLFRLGGQYIIFFGMGLAFGGVSALGLLAILKYPRLRPAA